MYVHRQTLSVSQTCCAPQFLSRQELCFVFLKIIDPFKAGYGIVAAVNVIQFFPQSEAETELVRRTDGIPVCLVFLKSTAGEASSQTTQLHCHGVIPVFPHWLFWPYTLTFNANFKLQCSPLKHSGETSLVYNLMQSHISR